MECNIGISLFWPVPSLHAPCHFLADSQSVANWQDGTENICGGRVGSVSLAEQHPRVQFYPQPTHTFRACPAHSPGPSLPETWLGGMAGGRKSASHSLTPEALLWGPHPITYHPGPLEKAGLGLGSTAWGRGPRGRLSCRGMLLPARRCLV